MFGTILAVLLRRLLHYLNVLIGVLFLAALITVYWLVYRPLPQTSGTIKAPVSARATIVRDERGVPHIQAATIEDAMFLQGFATAQDRFWQMDAVRRLGAGELSEIVGAAAVPLDRDSRQLRLWRVAEREAAIMPPDDRAYLAAYARGVNFYRETHRNNLPLEFTLLQYDPRPWTVTDSVIVGLMMYRDMTTSWQQDLQKNEMLRVGDPAKVAWLFRQHVGGDVQIGSNAWALAGSRTVSGKPLLASDPHLQTSMPSTWHQVHLQAPGLNVSGVALPGLPSVIIGHNDRIAWGCTNLHFDVQDVYMERLDPQSGRVQFGNQIEQAVPEREVIRVKGAAAIEFTNWVTRHGPTLGPSGYPNLTLRWSAADPGAFQFVFGELNRAKNWSEFTAALSRFTGPGQNFIYADSDGNIGYHAAGRLPIRRGFTGDVLLDGSSGAQEWEGVIPFEQLPSVYNPPGGVVASSNQNPFPSNYEYTVHGSFAAPYRARQVRALLIRKPKWRPEEMIAIQKDVYGAPYHHLGQMAVAAYDRKRPKDERLKRGVDLLRPWNGQMEKSLGAPYLASLLYDQLRTRVVNCAAPGKAADYQYGLSSAVVENLLQTRPKSWFADYDALFLDALQDAVEEGERNQGRNLNQWEYGRYMEITIPHPVESKIPWIGQYFNIGPVPVSGASQTVKQTTRRLLPSMRFVADTSDWDRSLLGLLIGESGQPLSSHYRDQWEAHYAGRGVPMPFRNVVAKGSLTVEVQ